MDTLHTMLTKGKIAMSDYRMWFHLNNKTKILILTPLGETDWATIMRARQLFSRISIIIKYRMRSRKYNKRSTLSQ